VYRSCRNGYLMEAYHWRTCRTAVPLLTMLHLRSRFDTIAIGLVAAPARQECHPLALHAGIPQMGSMAVPMPSLDGCACGTVPMFLYCR